MNRILITHKLGFHAQNAVKVNNVVMSWDFDHCLGLFKHVISRIFRNTFFDGHFNPEKIDETLDMESSLVTYLLNVR